MNRLKRLNRLAAKARQKNAHLITTAGLLSMFLVVVAGIDVVSTNAALAAGHVEGNPAVREVQAVLGTWWSAPKVGFHLVLGLFILWLPTRKMMFIARVVVIGYFAIFINNIYVTGYLV